MVSFPDVLVISVLALLLFGPERLPKVMRQAGRLMREMQNTSQAFIAEMERAADIQEASESEAEPKEEKEVGI
jgi:sec-independent protein translocase protein TatB